jgi:hypothetical protein
MAERSCSWKEKNRTTNSSGWYSKTVDQKFTRKNRGIEKKNESG